MHAEIRIPDAISLFLLFDELFGRRRSRLFLRHQRLGGLSQQRTKTKSRFSKQDLQSISNMMLQSKPGPSTQNSLFLFMIIFSAQSSIISGLMGSRYQKVDF